jgi:hypothetical protein
MSNPHDKAGRQADRHAQLKQTLEHAQQLVDSRPGPSHSPGWFAQAHHVGDMTVLALALQD